MEKEICKICGEAHLDDYEFEKFTQDFILSKYKPIMKIDPIIITEAFRISEIQGLDPVIVIIQDVDAGQGRVILECFGQSWTAYWGAMGSHSTREFLKMCSVDYLVGCFQRNEKGRALNYLTRIVTAIKEAINGHQ